MNIQDEILQVLHNGLSRIGIRKEIIVAGNLFYRYGWVSNVHNSGDEIYFNFSFEDGSPDEEVPINSPEMKKYIVIDRDCVITKRRDGLDRI